jgi:hypothetical protein
MLYSRLQPRINREFNIPVSLLKSRHLSTVYTSQKERSQCLIISFAHRHLFYASWKKTIFMVTVGDGVKRAGRRMETSQFSSMFIFCEIAVRASVENSSIGITNPEKSLFFKRDNTGLLFYELQNPGYSLVRIHSIGLPVS